MPSQSVRRSGQEWALARVFVIFLAIALALPALARAVAPEPATQQRLDLTIRFLQNIQNADGGYGGREGASSDPLFSAWVALALAAAGINPRNQAKPGGEDVYAYLAKNTGKFSVTTDFERVLLVVNASSGDPRNFGGRDLVETILSRQSANGSFRHGATGTYTGINDTAFAILALKHVGGERVNAAISKAADWLWTTQKASGGWGWSSTSEESADMTGAVLQAERAAGQSDPAAEAAAWEYLRSTQNPDGGFGYEIDDEFSNSASTAWATQALWAYGVRPDDWSIDGRTPLGFLASMQRPDGSISWTAQSDTNYVWMTAYSAPAMAGVFWPFPPVPFVPKSDADVDLPSAQVPVPVDSNPIERGRGGTKSGGKGNTVVGGGAGAPLFSRPKAGSKGRTPDAPRRTRNRSTANPNLAEPETQPGIKTTTSLTAGDLGGGGNDLTGVVIGHSATAEEILRSKRAAPGPRSADSGGKVPDSAVLLLAFLMLSLAVGSGLEFRMPDTQAPMEART